MSAARVADNDDVNSAIVISSSSSSNTAVFYAMPTVACCYSLPALYAHLILVIPKYQHSRSSRRSSKHDDSHSSGRDSDACKYQCFHNRTTQAMASPVLQSRLSSAPLLGLLMQLTSPDCDSNEGVEHCPRRHAEKDNATTMLQLMSCCYVVRVACLEIPVHGSPCLCLAFAHLSLL